MKIRNSSRIIAFALALVMIVPLISVPTFAADAVAENNTTILLENDFEDYSLAHKLGDDDFFAGDPNTGDGAYHTDSDAILAQVVANPDGEGKVWEVNSTKQNANSNTSVLQVPAVSYNDYAVVEYETKMYLPYNAAGVLQVQWNNNTTGWHTMYNIQYAASESEETATNAVFNNMNASLSVSYTIPRDEWFTISVQLELATGVRNIYVNDQLAFTASGGYTNVITKANTLYVNKIHKSYDAAGVIYVDDVVVSAHKNMSLVMYENDFESEGASADAIYASVPQSDIIDIDPKDSENKVVKMDMKTSHIGNNSVAIEKITKSFNYAVNPNLVFEYDFYVGEEAKGQVGISSYTGSTKVWNSIVALDLDNGVVTVNPKFDGNSTLTDTYGHAGFAQETWYKLAVAMNLVDGTYDVYIDGYKVLSAKMASANVAPTNIYWMKGAKATQAAGDGFVYYDNVRVYRATEPTDVKDGKRPATPYAQDFTNVSNAADMYASGADAAAIAGDAIIPDPTNKGMGKVWKVDISSHADKNTAPNSSIQKWFDHNAYDSIVYQYDFYVVAGATGKLGIDIGANGWFGICSLDLTNGKVTPSRPTSFSVAENTNTKVNEASFEKGTWYTFAMALNLDTGAYSLYLNGYKLVDAQLPYTGFSGNVVYINKAMKTGSSGTVYFDNVTVYEATEPTDVKDGVRPSDPYYEDFSVNAPEGNNAGVTTDPKNDGNNVAKIQNHHDDAVTHANVSKNYADVVLQADYYLDCEAGDVFNLKSDILNMDGKDANEASQEALWTTLFMIWHNEPTDIEHARLSLPSGVQQATYYRADAGSEVFVPVKEWFTVSVVINMKSGMYTIYVDGIAYAEASFASLTDLTWRSDSVWYVLKTVNTADKETINPGLAYVDNLAIYDAAGSLKEAEVDEGKDLQYIDVTIDSKTTRTLVTKYLAEVGKTFSANPVYFNDGGKYDAIVSKPIDGTTSVRYGEPTGLRFKTTINEALVAELQAMVANGTLKAVEMGTLIAPADWAADTAALKALKAYTSDEYNALETKPAAGTYALKVAVGEYYEENTIVGSIVNIKEGNYDRDFAAAGYVKVTLLSGKTVVIVAADATVDSVKDVAQRVIDAAKDGNVTLSTYQKNVLLGFGAVEA